jgi:hypothetical protein
METLHGEPKATEKAFLAETTSARKAFSNEAESPRRRRDLPRFTDSPVRAKPEVEEIQLGTVFRRIVDFMTVPLLSAGEGPGLRRPLFFRNDDADPVIGPNGEAP